MKDFLFVSKALGDGTRVRVLLALAEGELCVCQIVELLGLAAPTMSKHLYLLKRAGLVEDRKEAQWVYYRLPGEGASLCVRQGLDWVLTQAAKSATAAADRTKLRAILKIAARELCHQRRAKKGKGLEKIT